MPLDAPAPAPAPVAAPALVALAPAESAASRASSVARSARTDSIRSGPYSGGISLRRSFFNRTAYVSDDVLNVTASANVGIGTTAPGYKLHVNGTAAGTSWTNLSSRDLKEDIRKLNHTRYAQMLTRLKSVDLANYR
jgi:hypothetical protein